jgi:hypothetical protein
MKIKSCISAVSNDLLGPTRFSWQVGFELDGLFQGVIALSDFGEEDTVELAAIAMAQSVCRLNLEAQDMFGEKKRLKSREN